MSTTLFLNDEFDDELAHCCFGLKRALASLFFEYDGTLPEIVYISKQAYFRDKAHEYGADWIYPIDELEKLRKRYLRQSKQENLSDYQTGEVRNNIECCNRLIAMLERGERIKISTLN